ncbi:MAG: hypothetical protein ABJB40_01235 [Acidobacteriota bacterium]
MNNDAKTRDLERGSAGVKFVIVLLGLFLVGNAGYHYVPVAYEAESMRTDMQTAVVQGLALPGKISIVDNVKGRIQKAAQQNDVPTDVLIDVKQNGNVVTAHVAYTKQISMLPFGMYKYNYQFDHTATPTGFLLKQ